MLFKKLDNLCSTGSRQDIGIGAEMEISRRSLLPPHRILLHTAKGVIHALFQALECGPIGWKNSSEIDDIIVVRNVIDSRFPDIFPIGAEFDIILHNEIVIDVGAFLCQLTPKAEMAHCTTGDGLFPEKVVWLQKSLKSRGEFEAAPIHCIPALRTILQGWAEPLHPIRPTGQIDHVGFTNPFREGDTHFEVASVNIDCPTTCKSLTEAGVAIDLVKGIAAKSVPEREDTQNTLIMAMAEGLAILCAGPFRSHQYLSILGKFHSLFEEFNHSRGSRAE
jgi:hypothetical protein